MKTSWIWVVLAPLIGFLVPELADPDIVLEGLLTTGGYIGLVTLLTQVFKPLVGKAWKAWYEYKYFGETLSLTVALLLGYGAFFFNYGIFQFATWYYTLGMIIIAWFATNRWYDITLKEIQ